jgi:hypothetical protein
MDVHSIDYNGVNYIENSHTTFGEEEDWTYPLISVRTMRNWSMKYVWLYWCKAILV